MLKLVGGCLKNQCNPPGFWALREVLEKLFIIENPTLGSTVIRELEGRQVECVRAGLAWHCRLCFEPKLLGIESRPGIQDSIVDHQDNSLKQHLSCPL